MLIWDTGAGAAVRSSSSSAGVSISRNVSSGAARSSSSSGSVSISSSFSGGSARSSSSSSGSVSISSGSSGSSRSSGASINNVGNSRSDRFRPGSSFLTQALSAHSSPTIRYKHPSLTARFRHGSSPLNQAPLSHSSQAFPTIRYKHPLLTARCNHVCTPRYNDQIRSAPDTPVRLSLRGPLLCERVAAGRVALDPQCSVLTTWVGSIFEGPKKSPLLLEKPQCSVRTVLTRAGSTFEAPSKSPLLLEKHQCGGLTRVLGSTRHLCSATGAAESAIGAAEPASTGAESVANAESAGAAQQKQVRAEEGGETGEEAQKREGDDGAKGMGVGGEESLGVGKVKRTRRKAVSKRETAGAAEAATLGAAEGGGEVAVAEPPEVGEELGVGRVKRTRRKAGSKGGTAGAGEAVAPGEAAEAGATAAAGEVGEVAVAEPPELVEDLGVGKVKRTRRKTASKRATANAADAAAAGAAGEAAAVAESAAKAAQPAAAAAGAAADAGAAAQPAAVERWLVVVESPSKARTIQGYLQHAPDSEPFSSLAAAAAAAAGGGGGAGLRKRKREFSVLATHGHVRDVPNKVHAVSPDADFAIDWRILPQAVPHFRAIALAAFRSQGVVLATDADREGEAIAWHVYQLLKGAAAARRRAEAQQREKEERREKMAQQAVWHEEQLAAEAEQAAREGGEAAAAIRDAEGEEGEADIFSSGVPEPSLASPEAEGFAGVGSGGGAVEGGGEGLLQQVGEHEGGHVEKEGEHGWLEGEELLGEVRKELKDFKRPQSSLSSSSPLTPASASSPSATAAAASPSSQPPSPSDDQWLLPSAGSNGCDLTIHRATFHEITPSAVLTALANPRLLSQPLVDAYFARRVLDFLMGFNLSPVLWRKLPGCRSAGRVQSVALRFVCEREGEVAGFNAQEYWTVSAMVQACRTKRGLIGSLEGGETAVHGVAAAGAEATGAVGAGGGVVGEVDSPMAFPARLTHLFGEPVGAGGGGGGGGGGKESGRGRGGGKGGREESDGKAAGGGEGGIRDGERALAAAVLVEGSELQVAEVHRSQTRRSPSPPFTTSSLQQEASSKLGFSPSRTMAVAQRLYEGVALGPEASKALRKQAAKGAVGTEGGGKSGGRGAGGGMVTGLITYMRTDSVNVSAAAVASLRSLLQERYNSKMVSPFARVFSGKARNAQEAHEAIRPTHPHLLPGLVKADLSEEQWKLYALIWARFAASQMANAVYDRVAVDVAAHPRDPSLLSNFPSPASSQSSLPSVPPPIEAPDAPPSPMLEAPESQLLVERPQNASSPPAMLRANSFAIAWPGFLAAYSDRAALGHLSDLSEGISTEPPPGDATSAEADSAAATSEVFQEIMALQPGDRLLVESVDPNQHFTRPPPRYTEAALIKRMEAEGIGRPSTYAPTLKTLLDRKYVELDSRRLHPTIRGRLANAFLLHFMEPYVNAGFTARLESKFDDVAAGEGDWRKVLRTFWNDFQPRVEEMQKLSPQAVGSAVQVTLGDGLLVEAAATYSQVLSDARARASAPPFSSIPPSSATPSSSASPSPPTLELSPSAVATPSASSSVASLSPPSASKACPSCGSGELEYNFSSRGVGLFVGCSAYPTCHFKARVVEQEDKPGALAVAIDPVAHVIGEDPNTGAKIWLKVGPYGAYVERSSYGKVSKVNRASLPPGMHPDSVDLPNALELLAFPRVVGLHPEGGTVYLCSGPFGFYLEHDLPGVGRIRASLGTNVVIDDVTLESAIERLQVKQARVERAATRKAAKAAKTGKGGKAAKVATSKGASKGASNGAAVAREEIKGEVEGKTAPKGEGTEAVDLGKGRKASARRSNKGEAGEAADASKGVGNGSGDEGAEAVEAVKAGKGGKVVDVGTSKSARKDAKGGESGENERETVLTGEGAQAVDVGKGGKASAERSKEGQGEEAGVSKADGGKAAERGGMENPLEVSEMAGKKGSQEVSVKRSKEAGAADARKVDAAERGETERPLEAPGEAGMVKRQRKEERKEAGRNAKTNSDAEEKERGHGYKGGAERARLIRLPRRPSEQLKEIIGKEHEQLSLVEATSLVWRYVQANNLKTGPHTAAFDGKLKSLFAVESAHRFQLLSLLSRHMQPLDREGGGKPQAEDSEGEEGGEHQAVTFKESASEGDEGGGSEEGGMVREGRSRREVKKRESGLSFGQERALLNRLPRRPSERLKEVIGEHEQLSVFEAMSLVWSYIRANDLKTGPNTAVFDDKLKALFGVDSAHSLKLPGLLEKHMSPLDADDASAKAVNAAEEAAGVGGAASKAPRGARGAKRAAKEASGGASGATKSGEVESGLVSSARESSASEASSADDRDLRQLSPALKAVLGEEFGGFTLRETSQQVWQRVKEQGEKVEGGGRVARYRVDGQLQELLGVDVVTFIGLYSLLKKHMK
ncbi:hypothetical protein CLOM_g11470 [Closterium sp. NIES-68]|nr:hypothetical protein CLOM_g11470 [Closterium sp. NIES-68]